MSSSFSSSKMTVIILFFLSIFWGGAIPGYGQDYLGHNYTEADGLPSSDVYGITQDSSGRMWFATRSGISCYDSISWQNYNAIHGLPALTFGWITVDSAHRIWALSFVPSGPHHLVCYDKNKWKKVAWLNIQELDSNEITSFKVVELSGSTQNPIVVIGTLHWGMYLWVNNRWVNLTRKDGLPSDGMNGLVEWQGKCYVAYQKGIYVIDLNEILQATGKITVDQTWYQSLGLPVENIRGVAIEYQSWGSGASKIASKIWLLGEKGVRNITINSRQVTFFPFAPWSVQPGAVLQMQADYRGGIYVGNRMRLMYLNYKTRQWNDVGIYHGLSFEGSLGMFTDFEKNIWIGSNRGVNKITSRRFSNYQMVHGLLEDEVTAVLEYEPGHFILGHNRGVTFWDGKTFEPVSFSGNAVAQLVDCRILNVAIDSKKNIWLALNRAGLLKIDHDRKLTWYYEQTSRWSNFINALWVDAHDHLWLSSNKGVFRLPEDGQSPQFIWKPRPGEQGVRRIIGNSQGLHYLASATDGLWEYLGKSRGWKRYLHPTEKNANNIYALYEEEGLDKFGKKPLLVGALGGLYRLDSQRGELTKCKLNGQEINRPVFFITKDRGNRFWFGTDNGVVTWNTANNQIFEYSTADGLVGQECNRAAGFVDSTGKVWIGTNQGLSVYQAQFDDRLLGSPPPRLQLLSLETNTRTLQLDKPNDVNTPLQLEPTTHTFLFHFRGISFRDEQAIRFSYILEGFDKEWYTDQFPYQQMVRYSNLRPGHYRFLIKAKSAEGVWSQSVPSPEIIILLPFYKKWWFYVLMGLVAGLLLWGINRFLTQQNHASLLEKQVEERTHQLVVLEKKYRKLFAESKDAVFIATPAGRFIDINPAGIELFNLPLDAAGLVDKGEHSFFYTPEDGQLFQSAIAERGFVKDFELRLKRQDGEPLQGQITATAVRDGAGQIVEYRGIIRDITAQKQMEQQLHQALKMEAIGTLAGGIAHDFNNILGVITGYTELVLDDLQDGTPVHGNAHQILTASQRAADLVKQILVFSRQNDLEQKAIDLHVIISDALKLLRASLPSTIEIRHDFRAVHRLLIGNSTQMHQVIMNLGVNAAYAMRDRGGVLDVRLENVYLDEEAVKDFNNIIPGLYLRLTVSDTGHGMSSVVQKRIFDPYFTTKATGEGTGMGLSVIHGIVKSHLGDICVVSLPGKGTTFQIYFPCAETRDALETEPPHIDSIPGGSERILLIDDNIPLAEVGMQQLKRLGYQVTAKTSATEAVALFRAAPQDFDLVITDLTMPHMSGVEVADCIKEIKPGIPVILCSGFSAAFSIEESAGHVDDFVMKPIVKRELAYALRKALDNRK